MSSKRPDISKSEKPIWISIQGPVQSDGTLPPPVLMPVYTHVANGRVVRDRGFVALREPARAKGWRLLAVHGTKKPDDAAKVQDPSTLAGTDDIAELRRMLADEKGRREAAEKRAAEAEELSALALEDKKPAPVGEDEDFEDDDE